MSKPDFANGKICYLEIPANDVNESSEFFRKVFGWKIRNDNQGNISFDDPTGQVSGMWVTGRKPSPDRGVLISIMVYDMAETINSIIDNGGKIVQQPEDMGGSQVIALFADPAGNVFCLYEHHK